MNVDILKKEAVLQLCNFLCPTSLSEIKDLNDGEIFMKTIQARFPSYDLNQLDKSECEDTNPAIEDNVIRFNYIQNFIDVQYNIQSENIISYSSCTESELELCKVALFILSEIVKCSVERKEENLQTLCHLDIRYQVELEECFKLFISERDKISKTEVEELLAKSAENESLLVTPRRSSSRNSQQKSVSPTNLKEDIFSNSPLKAYFESPIFKKEDIEMKNKQIKNLENILNKEDEESCERQRKLSEANKTIRQKDNQIKQLQKQVRELNEDLEKESQLRQQLYKDLKEDNERLQDLIKNNEVDYSNRIMELSAEKAYLYNIIEEKRSLENLKNMKSWNSSPPGERNMLSIANKRINKLEEENEMLKKEKSTWVSKERQFHKQLSDLLREKIKREHPQGNLNQSYEEIWIKYSDERTTNLHKEMYGKSMECRGKEEIMASCIEADNRNLTSQLNEANLKIKELMQEKDLLKDEISKRNTECHPKRVCSVATMTSSILSTPKIIEKEKLRNSMNKSKNLEVSHLFDEPSYILNKSDNISSEQSVFSESEIKIDSGKLPEAVLWKTYDSQDSEMENTHTYDYNINHDCDVLENSNLDFRNNLEVSINKACNAETDISFGQENKYVLGNLNFNVFLKELKKLTKNGSFQKVLQVFGKRLKEMNGKKRSNKLNLQEILKITTECLCAAVALNAESYNNLQDKSCLTEESYFYTVDEQNEIIIKLKEDMCALSQKYEQDINRVNNEKSQLESNFNKELHKRDKKCQYLFKRFEATQINLDQKVKEVDEVKGLHSKMLASKLKAEENFAQLKYKLKEKVRIIEEFEKRCHKLKDQNEFLKKQLKETQALLEKQIQEYKNLEERKSNRYDLTETNEEEKHSRGSYRFFNYATVKSETQETCNESVSSDAFHKNFSNYVIADEDSLMSNTCLDVHSNNDGRAEEIKRRNSLLPTHLQSCYPTESLKTSHESLYIKDDKFKEENCSKKRKLEDVDEEPTTSQIITPQKKSGKPETPKSLVRLMKSIYRHRRPFKPK